MQKVKNYMDAYKRYAKAERAKFEELKKSNMYSMDYIAEQEKKLNQALDNKRQEYLKGINEVIDGKLAALPKQDTSSSEYQAAISNIFTKVQLLGNTINGKLLKEILAPAVEKMDNSTIQAVRSYIEGLQNFPGGDHVKRQVLESAPRIIDQAEVLENARADISNTFNDRDFGNGNLKSEISMQVLEQSGIFEL